MQKVVNLFVKSIQTQHIFSPFHAAMHQIINQFALE